MLFKPPFLITFSAFLTSMFFHFDIHHVLLFLEKVWVLEYSNSSPGLSLLSGRASSPGSSPLQNGGANVNGGSVINQKL